MRPMTLVWALALAVSLGLAPLAPAGEPETPDKGDQTPKPDKPRKLPTPTGVLCTKAGDALHVTWTPVVGAAMYRVELEVEAEIKSEAETTEDVVAPPYVVPMTEVLEIPTAARIKAKVKVRALPEGPGATASKPSEGVPCQ